MSTILGRALRAEFSDTQLREPVLPSGALNRAERDKIDELLEAEQALMAPLNEDNMFVVSGGAAGRGTGGSGLIGVMEWIWLMGSLGTV